MSHSLQRRHCASLRTAEIVKVSTASSSHPTNHTYIGVFGGGAQGGGVHGGGAHKGGQHTLPRVPCCFLKRLFQVTPVCLWRLWVSLSMVVLPPC